MTTEADTCRTYVLPKLYAAGWTDDQIREQKTFTDGRIVPVGRKAKRRQQKRTDYLLCHSRDFTLAVVEAKAAHKLPGDGLQQAKEYAEILGLKFAYATNGKGIIEHDYTTGLERETESFPGPDELWQRLRQAHGLTEPQANKLLAPYNLASGKVPRYYQDIAILRAVQAVLQGRRRALLTLATGTGKTDVAFQICWKLWNSRWNRTGEYRRPKILFLADRNVLVDDPYEKQFAPLGNARHKIEGEPNFGREMYFAIYQAIAEDKRRPGLYKEHARDFFDLIIIDECHRGSGKDESRWREILEYFAPAYQLGLTATPRREENSDTYAYFGDPLYTYSLRQGIEDGFLAPYKVYRVIIDIDDTGWRPDKGAVDRLGREIPDEVYFTPDYERKISLPDRTQAIARHLTEYLKRTDRFAKTIVFCVDQEHAEQMRHALSVLNADLVRQHPDFVARVVSDEGDVGKGHLSNFQDPEKSTPVILTTSQMLTTGVDAPTCKNVVLCRVVRSMIEFKQIIGRGTRVREAYGKLFFTIVDYTGCATRLFKDPAFDGEPVVERNMGIDEAGDDQGQTGDDDHRNPDYPASPPDNVEADEEPRKYYVDGVIVTVMADLVYELDADGRQLRVVKLVDYTAEGVRTLARSAAELRARWTTPRERGDIIQALEERGIAFDELAQAVGQPDADPFDLLCHLAWGAPILTRRERAERMRREERAFLEAYGPEARQILDAILEKYAEHGISELNDLNVLKVEPIASFGNFLEIGRRFGGTEKLRIALQALQEHLYSA